MKPHIYIALYSNRSYVFVLPVNEHIPSQIGDWRFVSTKNWCFRVNVSLPEGNSVLFDFPESKPGLLFSFVLLLVTSCRPENHSGPSCRSEKNVGSWRYWWLISTRDLKGITFGNQTWQLIVPKWRFEWEDQLSTTNSPPLLCLIAGDKWQIGWFMMIYGGPRMGHPNPQ